MPATAARNPFEQPDRLQLRQVQHRLAALPNHRHELEPADAEEVSRERGQAMLRASWRSAFMVASGQVLL